MAKRVRVHYAFNAGEADPQFERRADWENWINSAESMRNCRLRNGGGWKRRPGLAHVADLSSAARLIPFRATDGAKKLVILEDDAFRVMNTDETFEATLTTGQVWASADLQSLQFDSENDDITLTSHAFWPQVLTRAAGGTWSVADLEFLERGDTSVAQPYYRFPETKGITITPSAVSGAGITLTASAALFTADHVNARFLLVNREVTVTAYTDSTHVTATVVQTIYPTLDITVGSSSSFASGDQVETSVEEASGEVVSIVSPTKVRVQMLDTFDTPTTTSNNLIGPSGKSAISAITTAASPAAVNQWYEQLVSVERGYPAGNCYHRGRRCLFNFESAGDLFVASVQDETSEFDVGTAADDDAIQARIGDALGQTIRHGVSAEQLIVLTDVGPYYVGEGPGTPFTPTTVDFLDIGPEPAADCDPVKTAEGVIYVDRDVPRLMVLAPTGNVRRSWETGDLSDIAPHLLTGLTRLALIDGSEWGPERYLAGINADGDLAVMHYRRGEQVYGWTPWDTDGSFIDICRFDNKVYAVVLRGTDYFLERFDDDRLLDDSTLKSGTSSITDIRWASADWEVVWRDTVDGEDRRASIGTFTANGSGVISGLEAEARDYEVGRPITLTCKLWPPIDPSKPFRNAIRLSRVIVDIVDSGYFEVNDNPISPYSTTDDLTALPPLRTRNEHVDVLGVEFDLTMTITQPVAAPLEVRAILVEAS